MTEKPTGKSRVDPQSFGDLSYPTPFLVTLLRMEKHRDERDGMVDRIEKEIARREKRDAKTAH